MVRAAIMLAAVLLVLVPSPLPAAAQAVVDEPVSDEATEGNSQPKLARDAAGTIYLIYVKPSGGFDQIFVAASTDGGSSWRRTQLTRRTVQSRYPALAVERDGTLHAAWTTYEPVGHVYYARQSGGRWTVPVKISPGSEYAGIPALAVTGDRQLHVVWYGIRNQPPQVRTRHGSIYEIVYTRLAGGRWSRPIVISPGIPDSINPALAADGSGTLHSAWYQFDMRAYQVRFTRRRGPRWDLPHQITMGPVDAFAVALGLGPGGRVYLVWERRPQDGARIFFTEGPERWAAPLAISGPGASHPTVAADTQGRVFAAWESEGRLQLRRRTDRWLNIERLMEDGQNRYPVLGGAHADTIDLIWTQEIGGRHRVRFVTVAGGAAAPRRGGGIGPFVLMVLALLLLWQLRRRQRLAPR